MTVQVFNPIPACNVRFYQAFSVLRNLGAPVLLRYNTSSPNSLRSR